MLRENKGVLKEAVSCHTKNNRSGIAEEIRRKIFQKPFKNGFANFCLCIKVVAETPATENRHRSCLTNGLHSGLKFEPKLKRFLPRITRISTN